MIVTPPAIAYAFLSALGLVVGGLLVGFALVARREAAARGDRAAEPPVVAALLLGQALLAIRLFAWPVYYAMLVSYIPLTPRAMCVFGVTRKVPWLTRPLELLEPFSLLIAGAVFLVVGAYRGGGAGVKLRSLINHLLLAGLVSLLVSGLGLTYLFVPKGAEEVSCCGAVFTSPDRLSAVATVSLLGPAGAPFVLPLAVWLAIVLAALQVWFHVRAAGRIAHSVVAAVALAHGLIAVLALFEAVAPVLLDRPLHHCAYCLASPRNFPPWVTLTGLVALGVATAVPVWIAWLGHVTSTVSRHRRWLALSIASLAVFWSLTLVPYLGRQGSLAPRPAIGPPTAQASPAKPPESR